MSNPAHRLDDILTRSKAVQNKNMLQGWREVLSLPQDMSELIVFRRRDVRPQSRLFAPLESIAET